MINKTFKILMNNEIYKFVDIFSKIAKRSLVRYLNKFLIKVIQHCNYFY